MQSWTYLRFLNSSVTVLCKDNDHTWADDMMTNFVKTTSVFMVVPDVLSHWIQLLGSFYRTKKSQSVLIKRTSRNRQPTACTEAPLGIQLQLPKDLLREIKMLTSCSYPQSANNATCRSKNNHFWTSLLNFSNRLTFCVLAILILHLKNTTTNFFCIGQIPWKDKASKTTF